MGVVFGILLILMISIRIITWLDARLTARENRASEADPQPVPPATPQAGPTNEVVAAITVAIALAQSREKAATPMTAAAEGVQPQSAWLAAGRRREMDRTLGMRR
jgi:sodium pump decarboxylase gamma subunit